MRHVLIVDGYNILGAWQQATNGRNLDDARVFLIEKLHNYAGFTGQKVILVFDAYQSNRMKRTEEVRGNLQIVYTQHAETADHYIESTCDGYKPDIEKERVQLRVASSDSVEQTVVLGRGATRLSARELINEIMLMRTHERELHKKAVKNHPLVARLPEDVQAELERMRRGK